MIAIEMAGPVVADLIQLLTAIENRAALPPSNPAIADIAAMRQAFEHAEVTTILGLVPPSRTARLPASDWRHLRRITRLAATAATNDRSETAMIARARMAGASNLIGDHLGL